MSLRFRPHHFLCTVGFEGKGYSPEFIRNYQEIVELLRGPQGGEVVIEVVDVTDSICGSCPSRRDLRCETETKIQALDQAHARILGLRPGDRVTWGEAKALLARKMTVEQHRSACAACAWRSLGVCEANLKALRGKSKGSAAMGVIIAVLLAGITAIVAPAPGFKAFAEEAYAATRAKKPKPSSEISDAAEKKAKTSAEKPDAAEKKTKSSAEKPEAPGKKAKTSAEKSDAAKVKRIQEALAEVREGKFSAARKRMQPLSKDKLLSDYAYFILAESHLAEAARHLKGRKYVEAVSSVQLALNAFAQFEMQYPASPLMKRAIEDVVSAELTQGDAWVGRKGWQSAEAAYGRAFTRAFDLRRTDLISKQALENYSLVCSKNGSDLCSAWMQRFANYYSRSSDQVDALASHYPEIRELESPRLVSKLVQAYKAPDLDQAAFDKIMLDFLDGSYKDAARGIERFLDEFPKSKLKLRARYLLARSWTHLKDDDKANRVYEDLLHDGPLGYYGLVGSVQLGKSLDSIMQAKNPLSMSESDPFLLPHELVRLKRIRLFLANGARELASAEFEGFRARDSLSSPFLAYLASLSSQCGNYLGSFVFITELIQRGYEGVTSPQMISMIFPQSYLDVIRKYSEVHKVDPILILSLMKQESAFDSSAVSGAGATGLMQLMPATAASVEKDVGKDELREVDTNVRIGVKYLKQVLDRFNGNIVLALAGYNAGPNAVNRWLKDSQGKREMLDFIEGIPYAETRDYVSSIIRNYYWYSKLLDHPLPPSLGFFWSGSSGAGSPSPVPVGPLPPEPSLVPVGNSE